MSVRERGSGGVFIYACSMRQNQSERSRTILRRISASVGPGSPGRLVRVPLTPGVVGENRGGDRWVPWLKPPIILSIPLRAYIHARVV